MAHLSIIDFEKALATIIAEVTEMELGTSVFTAELPPDDSMEIVAVSIGNDNSSRLDQGRVLRVFASQVVGRFALRETAMQVLAKIEEAVPLRGIKRLFFEKGINIKLIDILDTGSPEPSENNGNPSYLIHVVIEYVVYTESIVL